MRRARGDTNFEHPKLRDIPKPFQKQLSPFSALRGSTTQADRLAGAFTDFAIAPLRLLSSAVRPLCHGVPEVRLASALATDLGHIPDSCGIVAQAPRPCDRRAAWHLTNAVVCGKSAHKIM